MVMRSSRATYIDLDLLTTLETRITSLQVKNGCPVYYLGWTQQTTQPWRLNSKPNSFDLNQARAILLHLPSDLHESLFDGPESAEKQMANRKSKQPVMMHLLLIANQGSTCGELLDFCNAILADNRVSSDDLR